MAEALYLSHLRFYMENLTKNITDLKSGKNPRAQRSNVYLDGRFAFSLDNEVIAREKLKVGKELSPAEISKLAGADRFHLCLNSAFQFLTCRPRSESETRERLEKKGYDSQEIDMVITRLKEMRLLDDSSFAEFWKDNRNSFKPRSQRMVGLELRRKGVESEIIREVVGNIDDAENAYRLAVSKSRTLAKSDFQVFRQKLGSYLQRRGYNYGVINAAVKRVWQEQTQNTVTGSDISDSESLD
jgi:regulatory protein